MKTFQYKALNSDGQIITGTISASSEEELEAKLQDLRLELISCSISRQSRFTIFSERVE